ncbi:MAG: class I SAM-dependent methyltransferase [Nanoarchaeota archaeon]|nr:class I SAM-dependent methyltransferase [Nanoarchaeota archaeon]
MDKIEIAEKCWKSAIQRKSSYYKSLYRDLKFKIEYPVLEIGGGAGTFLRYNDIKEATILDVAGGTSLAGDYKFIKTDITQRFPKLNKKFKTIFAMEVLEHIKNPLYIMSQVYDLLEGGGRGYIAIPYTPLDPKRIGNENPFDCHVCRWTKNEIIDQMQKIGFKVRVIQQRRRFKNTAFYLPHCWLVLELKKRMEH